MAFLALNDDFRLLGAAFRYRILKQTKIPLSGKQFSQLSQVQDKNGEANDS